MARYLHSRNEFENASLLAWFLHKRKKFCLLRFISTENLLSLKKALTFAISKIKQQIKTTNKWKQTTFYES